MRGVDHGGHGFVPCLRFCVCSDVHLKERGDEASRRLRAFISLCKEYSRSEAYPGVDAFFFVGDSADGGTRDQFLAFHDLLEEAVGSESEVFAVLARHHDNWENGRNGEKTGLLHYRELFGKETDFHFVLGGFHFIGISTCGLPEIYYTAEQKTWLDSEIEKAVDSSPEKPVFVFQHEPPTGTIFGSREFDRWGIDYFNDVFEKYPSIVHFSGHSHYPLNDPRSVLQNKYTAVGLGTLAYIELTVKKQRSVFPEEGRTVAQGLIVEVNEDGDLRLIGVDALNGESLCEIFLPNPGLRDNLKRTFSSLSEKSSAPVFPPDAQITAEKTDDGLSVAFPAARGSDDDPVFAYFIKSKGSDGSILDEAFFVHPYWLKEEKKRFCVTLPSTEATLIEITAENSFEKQSEKLSKEI